ncbi:hypothetical protein, partial [Bordetella avium]|uniref:hypothetical protein n=1 Tax=Bordetella avium TaxID=521 RepID=UPI001B867DB8
MGFAAANRRCSAMGSASGSGRARPLDDLSLSPWSPYNPGQTDKHNEEKVLSEHQKWRLETIAVHGGYRPDPTT